MSVFLLSFHKAKGAREPSGVHFISILNAQYVPNHFLMSLITFPKVSQLTGSAYEDNQPFQKEEKGAERGNAGLKQDQNPVEQTPNSTSPRLTSKCSSD